MTIYPGPARALTDIQYVGQGPHASADFYAREKLGVHLAELITWQYRDGTDHGTITCTDRTINFRYEMAEPGSERLEVPVPCPDDPTCSSCWDGIEDVHDFTNYLTSGTAAAGDPLCDDHDLYS